MDILVDTSVDYLAQQIEAGADTVMVFDSWAGTLPDREFAAWVTAPTARLVRDLKERHPTVPVIGFPRGAGSNALGFVKETGVRGVGCDTAMPLERDAHPRQGGRRRRSGQHRPVAARRRW